MQRYTDADFDLMLEELGNLKPSFTRPVVRWTWVRSIPGPLMLPLILLNHCSACMLYSMMTYGSAAPQQGMRIYDIRQCCLISVRSFSVTLDGQRPSPLQSGSGYQKLEIPPPTQDAVAPVPEPNQIVLDARRAGRKPACARRRRGCPPRGRRRCHHRLGHHWRQRCVSSLPAARGLGSHAASCGHPRSARLL